MKESTWNYDLKTILFSDDFEITYKEIKDMSPIFKIDEIREENVRCLKELEQIEEKRAARCKSWEDKRKKHFIRAGEISGLIDMVNIILK